MKASKYVGPWNKQCPYCFARKVRQDVHVFLEDGIRHEEFEDSANCLKCGKAWQAYEVQIPACVVCGVHHSFDICNETPYKRSDGTIHHYALMICHNCGTFTVAVNSLLAAFSERARFFADF